MTATCELTGGQKLAVAQNPGSGDGKIVDVLQIVPKDGEEFLVIRLCSNAEEIVDELPLAHDIPFCSPRI